MFRDDGTLSGFSRLGRNDPDRDVDAFLERLHVMNVRAIDLTGALLLQLTTNLLHNEIIHNLPEGGTVWARTEVGSGGVELIVENIGEKLAPDLIATFTEPFHHGTERVRSDQAGVGLGLTAVRSIVQAHDAALTVTRRRLRVSAKLPSGSVGSMATSADG